MCTMPVSGAGSWWAAPAAQESMGSMGMSNVVRGILAGAVICAAVHAITPAALAEGAIAIGASGNFAKDGFAFGGAINKSSSEEAKQQALATCKKYEGAPKMAAICKVFFTFS